MPKLEPIYSMRDIAEELGVCRKTINARMKKGTFPRPDFIGKPKKTIWSFNLRRSPTKLLWKKSTLDAYKATQA